MTVGSVGGLLKEALHGALHTVGIPEAAPEAMLFDHARVALANTSRGSNPLCDVKMIAMDYGRRASCATTPIERTPA